MTSSCHWLQWWPISGRVHVYLVTFADTFWWLFRQYHMSTPSYGNTSHTHLLPLVTQIYHWGPLDFPHKGPVNATDYFDINIQHNDMLGIIVLSPRGVRRPMPRVLQCIFGSAFTMSPFIIRSSYHCIYCITRCVISSSKFYTTSNKNRKQILTRTKYGVNA